MSGINTFSTSFRTISSNLCRACLVITNKEYNVLNELWLEKYMSCIGGMLIPKDNQFILCKSCAKSIDTFYKFKKKCLENEKFWQTDSENKAKRKALNMVYDIKCVKYEVDSNPTPIVDVKSESDDSYDNVDHDNVDHDNVDHDNDENDNEDQMDHDDHNYSGYVIKPETSYKIEDNFSNTSRRHGRATPAGPSRIIPSIKSKSTSKSKSIQNLRVKPGISISQFLRLYSNKKPIPSSSKTSSSSSHEEKLQEPEQTGNMIHRKKIANESDDLENQEIACGLCEEISSNQSDAGVHFVDHYSNGELRCRLCDYQGRDFADLIQHRSAHTSYPSIYQYGPCHFCPKKFRNSTAAAFHFRRVHLQLEKGGWCEVCGKRYGNLGAYTAHVRSHSEWNYECDLCGIKFIQRSQIVVHLKAHTLHRDYVCDICGTGLRTAFSLKNHKLKHFDTLPVKCDHCQKMFKRQHNLDQHLKRLKREKNFICTMCDKAYVTRCELAEHNLTHTDERPYQCEICNKCYKSAHNYRAHVKLVHKPSTHFECKVCRKKSTSKEMLQQHYYDTHKIDDDEIEKMKGIVECRIESNP